MPGTSLATTELSTLPVGTHVRLLDYEHFSNSTKNGEMFTVIDAPTGHPLTRVTRSHRSGLAVSYPAAARWEVI